MEYRMLSKEDLLVRMAKLKAENSLLRSQLVECGKDKALISELEHKLKNATDYRVIELNQRVEKLTQTVQNQRSALRQLNRNIA